MKNSAKSFISDLARQFENEDNAGFDLWTHLPSYKEAQKFHGDYASEYRPTTADLLIEATMYISHGANPNEEQIARAGEMYLCPCGEDHYSTIPED